MDNTSGNRLNCPKMRHIRQPFSPFFQRKYLGNQCDPHLAFTPAVHVLTVETVALWAMQKIAPSAICSSILWYHMADCRTLIM